MAKALAAQMGWDAVSFSTYDANDAERWQKSLSASFSGSSLFCTAQLVLLEDVDIWPKGGMRGSITFLAQLLQDVRVPVLITAGDWYDRTLVPLRSLVEQLQMKAVNSSDMGNALHSIALRQGVKVAPETVSEIAQRASGDLRAAINDLQASNSGASRERGRQIFEKVRIAIRSPNYRASKAMGNLLLADRDMLKMYVAENIPGEFPDENDRARALSRLSRADIFDGRIMRRQYWGYLRYSTDLMLWGVSSERLHPGSAFATYGFPSYIQKMGASRARRAIFKAAAKKIAAKTHTTSNTARAFFPLLALQNDSEALCAIYGFDEEEAAAVSGKATAKPARAAAKKPAAKKPSTAEKA
jgi:replication factor C large subunit